MHRCVFVYFNPFVFILCLFVSNLEIISWFQDLSRNILRGISLALGGSPYAFEGEMVGDPFWVMRIIGYPGVNQENVIGW